MERDRIEARQKTRKFISQRELQAGTWYAERKYVGFYTSYYFIERINANHGFKESEKVRGHFRAITKVIFKNEAGNWQLNIEPIGVNLMDVNLFFYELTAEDLEIVKAFENGRD